MRKSKHTETAIIAALKQVEAGRKVEDEALEVGVSKNTLYAWKAKYGGLEVNEAQRLRSLEDENSWLKRLVADLSLDREMLEAISIYPSNASKSYTTALLGLRMRVIS